MVLTCMVPGSMVLSGMFPRSVVPCTLDHEFTYNIPVTNIGLYIFGKCLSFLTTVTGVPFK